MKLVTLKTRWTDGVCHSRKHIIEADRKQIKFINDVISESTLSKDVNSKVGALIVDKNNVRISSGYNGAPRTINDSFISYSREKVVKELDGDWSLVCGDDCQVDFKSSWQSDKYNSMIHAEENAIIHSPLVYMDDCTMYVTHDPCPRCADKICQVKIKKVISLGGKDSNWSNTIKDTLFMFEKSGVEFFRVIQ
jgi:dCMP deaminase